MDKQQIIQEAYWEYWEIVKDFVYPGGWLNKMEIPLRSILNIKLQVQNERYKPQPPIY